MADYFSLILNGYLEWESPILVAEIHYLGKSLMVAVQMNWRKLNCEWEVAEKSETSCALNLDKPNYV
jgi:hypothetical protein